MREHKKERVRDRGAESGWHSRSFFHLQNRDEKIERAGAAARDSARGVR